MPPPRTDDAWLARPRTIRALWLIFAAVLASTVLADLVIPRHGDFGIDGTVGFYAWFGFASCVVLILGARALGFLLKRRDDYYDG